MIFTPEEKQFIRDNYLGIKNKDLTSKLNQTFGTNFTIRQVKAFKHKSKLDSGLTGYFPKGNESWNKGKYVRYSPATEFKKGNKPANWVPLGTEKLKADGYVYVKVQDGKLNRNWKQKHIMLWEKNHGPIPQGSCVIFADGNKLNFELENLILIKRSQLLIMNKNKLIYDDPELTKTGVIISSVIDSGNKKIKRRKKNECSR
jgi:hypothetical protein